MKTYGYVLHYRHFPETFTPHSWLKSYTHTIGANCMWHMGKQGYENLEDLLILKLQSLYDCEHEILKQLPRMAKAAHDDDLVSLFEEHCEETEGQIQRLEKALGALHAPKKKNRVEAIRGLAKDAAWIVQNVKKPESRDALLIAAAQYVEHYEIAGYSTVKEWADLMERSDVADLLEETLAQEEDASEKLHNIAEGINELAHEEGEESEE